MKSWGAAASIVGKLNASSSFLHNGLMQNNKVCSAHRLILLTSSIILYFPIQPAL